jgi:Helix-turn-helix family
VSEREANVVQAAAGITPRHVLAAARDYDDAEWEALVTGLTQRGLLTTEGKLTPEGQR